MVLHLDVCVDERSGLQLGAMSRPTNQQVCLAFRALLAADAVDMAEAVAMAVSHTDNPTANMVLEASKQWRGDLWKAFAEVERRLCPQPVLRPIGPADLAQIVKKGQTIFNPPDSGQRPPHGHGNMLKGKTDD